MKVSAFAAVLAVVMIASIGADQAAFAQSTATLIGVVTDQQGRALPGAVVVAQHQATGTSLETTTATDGRFSLTVPRAGGYKLAVNMTGFALQGRRDVIVVEGESTKVDFELQLASVTESVVVTAGAALARDEKRAAPTIMDVVSADSVGRFPDANAAEALRRVPGVAMEIDQGEGRFVVVRGIDASLNNVTLNGQAIGTPAEFGTRGVSMDAVPADLISRLEVVKALRPDMDANAIARPSTSRP